MKKISFVVVLLSTISCIHKDEKIDKDKLTGNDFRLFLDTPAWHLADAVENEKTEVISKILEEKKIDPDFPEPKYGGTLLSLAIMNDKSKSVQTLLKYGADPNKPDKYRGTTPMVVAASNDNQSYIPLLLKNGGNPNAGEKNSGSQVSDNARTTPLNAAISLSKTNTLERVKMLVKAGADINFSSTEPFETPSPLSDSFVHKKLDVALYLLQNGADYKKPLYKMINGHNVYILEALRKSVIELNTDEFKIKKNIIDLLRHKGLYYEQEPIPDYILKDIKRKYPNDWENYIKSY